MSVNTSYVPPVGRKLRCGKSRRQRMAVPSEDADVVRHVHAARLSVQEEIDRAMVRVNLLDLRDAVHFLRDLRPRRRQAGRRDSGGHDPNHGEQVTLRHDRGELASHGGFPSGFLDCVTALVRVPRQGPAGIPAGVFMTPPS